MNHLVYKQKPRSIQRNSKQFLPLRSLQSGSKFSSIESNFQNLEVPIRNHFKQSFKSTETKKSSSKSNGASHLQKNRLFSNFSNQIQQSDHRIASKIQNLQQKMKCLKNFFNNDNPSSQSTNWRGYHGSSKNERPLTEIRKQIIINDQPLQTKKYSNLNNDENQKTCGMTTQREYARQLKNKNFVDDIKRKIQEIQSQRKSNVEKKLSEIKSLSNASFNSKNTSQACSQQDFLSLQQKGKFTFKNYDSFLVQSEIIEVNEQLKQTFLLNDKEISEYSSVIQKFDPIFVKQKLKASDLLQISKEAKEQSEKPRTENLLNSHITQKNLEETQMVERNSLKGDFSGIEQKLQKQFTTLINRLAFQAQIDNKFLTQIFKYNHIFSSKKQTLTNILLAAIRSYCHENGIAFNEESFEISQIQIDPLLSTQKTYKDFSVEEINKMAFKLRQDSDKISSYFTNKIYHQFSQKSVQFLVEELQKCHQLRENQLFNVGHLTSYINMRTGKNLRNRFFYRTIKRILRNPKSISTSFNKNDLVNSLVNEKNLC